MTTGSLNTDEWTEEICTDLGNLEDVCRINLPNWRTDDFCSLQRPCKDNQYRDEKGVCKPNVCKCENGEKVPNSQCTKHNDNQCISCKNNFVLTKYRAINTATNFDGAIELCKQNSMKIAKIFTEQESNLMKSTFRKINHINLDFDKSIMYWVGSRKLDGYFGSNINSFFWTNDEGEIRSTLANQVSAGFHDWFPGEPNNPDSQKCMALTDEHDLIKCEYSECNLKMTAWNCDSENLRFWHYDGIGAMCQFEASQCFKDRTVIDIPKFDKLKYHFWKEKLTRSEHIQFCLSQNMAMARFYSDEDYNQFYNDIIEQQPEGTRFLLGARFDYDTPFNGHAKDGFYWVDDDGYKIDFKYPLYATHQNWRVNQPSFRLEKNEKQYCVEIFNPINGDSHGNGRLMNDVHCNREDLRWEVVCEERNMD